MYDAGSLHFWTVEPYPISDDGLTGRPWLWHRVLGWVPIPTIFSASTK